MTGDGYTYAAYSNCKLDICMNHIENLKTKLNDLIDKKYSYFKESYDILHT